MKLESVLLQNFMSHKQTELDLSISERLQIDGKNGSGKTSSVVDGPLWALFGNARGSTIDQLRGKFGTRTAVSVRFEVRGKTYRVTRDRGSTSGLSLVNETDNIDLTEKHVKLTQERIRSLVGTYGSFVNSAVFRQGDALRFALMKPEERRSLFEELLELEAMAEIETRSNRARSSNLKNLEESQRKLEEIEGYKLEITQAELSLWALNDQLDKVKPELDDAELTLASVAKDMNDMIDAQTQRNLLAAEVEKAERAYLRSEGNARELVSKQQEYTRRANEYQVAICPTCKQPIGSLEAAKKREEFQQAATEWTMHLSNMHGEIKINESKWQDYKRQLEQLDKAISEKFSKTKALQEHANQVLPGLRRQVSGLNIEIAKLEGQISTLKGQSSSEAQVKTELEEQRKRHTAYGLISEAFSKRGIPRELMRGFVSELEKSTNVLFGTVSNMKLRIGLDKDGTTKHGVTEGTVDVWVEDTAGERRVEMLSGGEKMRAMTAFRLAIAQVQAKRSDRAIRTLILDESLDGLDQEGKDAMLTMLSSMSATAFDRMLFVTHDPAVAGLFPDRVTLSKTSDDATVIL